jgi:hypothetical protein
MHFDVTEMKRKRKYPAALYVGAVTLKDEKKKIVLWGFFPLMD